MKEKPALNSKKPEGKDKPTLCDGKKSVCGINNQFTGRGIFSCVYYDNVKEMCTYDGD